MPKNPRWETHTMTCPEDPDRTASLLVEWDDEQDEPILKSISCDNPRLADIDNWDCKWSCWEKIRTAQVKAG